MNEFLITAQVTDARKTLDRLKANMRQAVKGKDDVIERRSSALPPGALLIEELPGLGKTTLAYALARSMDCSFSRVQFTSDLLPSDVKGVAIYDEHVREFVFKPGPILPTSSWPTRSIARPPRRSRPWSR